MLDSMFCGSSCWSLLIAALFAEAEFGPCLCARTMSLDLSLFACQIAIILTLAVLRVRLLILSRSIARAVAASRGVCLLTLLAAMLGGKRDAALLIEQPCPVLHCKLYDWALRTTITCVFTGLMQCV